MRFTLVVGTANKLPSQERHGAWVRPQHRGPALLEGSAPQPRYRPCGPATYSGCTPLLTVADRALECRYRGQDILAVVVDLRFLDVWITLDFIFSAHAQRAPLQASVTIGASARRQALVGAYLAPLLIRSAQPKWKRTAPAPPANHQQSRANRSETSVTRVRSWLLP